MSNSKNGVADYRLSRSFLGDYNLIFSLEIKFMNVNTTVLWYTNLTLSEREKGTRNGNGERQDQEDPRYD